MSGVGRMNSEGSLLERTFALGTALTASEAAATIAAAERVMAKVDALVEADRPIRVHWTGCPNSCGQVQAADIGLMGGPAKKVPKDGGKAKAVPGVKIFVGGTIGEHGKLSLDPEIQGIPIEDLLPVLTELVVDRFDGEIKPEYAAEQAAYRKERDAAKA